MCDEYRVSSSVKVEQMEADLSRLLSALRAEIEETGFPQGAVTSRCYRCGSLNGGCDYFVCQIAVAIDSVFVLNCLDCQAGGT